MGLTALVDLLTVTPAVQDSDPVQTAVLDSGFDLDFAFGLDLEVETDVLDFVAEQQSAARATVAVVVVGWMPAGVLGRSITVAGKRALAYLFVESLGLAP